MHSPGISLFGPGPPFDKILNAALLPSRYLENQYFSDLTCRPIMNPGINRANVVNTFRVVVVVIRSVVLR